MKKQPTYSPEIKDRAVRLVLECESEHQSRWIAIQSVAAKMKSLECEVKELKKANEILRKAAAFFAQAEPDRKYS